MSKELFLCIRTPRKLPLKVNKAKGTSLLPRNLKIQKPTNKLIPYKFSVLCKTQPNLLENYTCWNTGKKLFSNVLMSKELFLVKKPPTHFFLKVRKTKGMPLFSRNFSNFYKRKSSISIDDYIN